MLSILEPTFLLLIVIGHHPMNTFGGTMPEESSISDLSEAVKKLEIVVMKKDIEDTRRFSDGGFPAYIPVIIKPQQSEFHDISTNERSMGEKNSPNYDEQFNCIGNCRSEDESCSTATLRNESKDGIYLLKGPNPDLKPFYVYCQHENKTETAWTVIQRRQEGSKSFNRTWLDYKLGFGDLNGEYWIGLERLHQITNSQLHELLIVLYDFEIEKAYVKYPKLVVGSEDKNYELTVGNEEGIPPDSFLYHKSRRFSDPDHEPCTRLYGGGWWHHSCLRYTLYGAYFSSSNMKRSADDWGESLHKVVMAIRPKEV